MKIRKGLIFMFAISLSFFGMTSCGGENSTPLSYEQITMKQAKDMMDTGANYVLIDARTEEEFRDGHIAGAINLNYEEIREKAPEILPEKDALILLYCRSGRRSKIAAEILVELGYRNVKEFGGIIDWPYEIVKE